ncbi:hypothetical protein AB0A70_04325 [Streptomyces morookaense]|uniref:hypothetical protein n=1 Tax=Streptomyces morookaense TaxID=1970 RepID=UPI0033ED9144
MFEIRIICDPSDSERISAAVRGTFKTGAIRRLPSRTPGRERLYLKADHLVEPQLWPTPEEAYAAAPSIVHEMDWTTAFLVDSGILNPSSREFWLRKAAVLDRIALTDKDGHLYGDADDLALKAARRLLNLDLSGDGDYGGIPFWPEHPEADANPRGYVRQEYATWRQGDCLCEDFGAPPCPAHPDSGP